MSSLQALKDAHKKGIVVGLKAISETQLRQDIDLFLYNDPDAFNLFLLALAKLQDPEMANEKMGFFHIAGMQVLFHSKQSQRLPVIQITLSGVRSAPGAVVLTRNCRHPRITKGLLGWCSGKAQHRS